MGGVGKTAAMMTVLRMKWRLPGFRELLLTSAGMYLTEHGEVANRDLVWTDNYRGGGENRLGACLMLVREEIVAEATGQMGGWPEGIHRPPWAGGPDEDNNWQSVVDCVANYLADNTREPPLTAPSARQ